MLRRMRCDTVSPSAPDTALGARFPSVDACRVSMMPPRGGARYDPSLIAGEGMEQDQALESPDGPQQLLVVVGGYALSAALSVAVELDIADHLSAGPRPVEELARRTG